MADGRSRHSFLGANSSPRGGRVTAVLGPTNTGKTHFAIERMLAHRSGMIGLPLRLLAREVYDKIVRLNRYNIWLSGGQGVMQVAMILIMAHFRF